MPNIIPLTPVRPIVDDRGYMTQEAREWFQSITRLDLIIGTGSPEGVVSASIGREYMDDTGVAGAIKYIKRDSDIGGDDRFGWILI